MRRLLLLFFITLLLLSALGWTISLIFVENVGTPATAKLEYKLDEIFGILEEDSETRKTTGNLLNSHASALANTIELLHFDKRDKCDKKLPCVPRTPTPICNYYDERVTKSCQVELVPDLAVGVITYSGNHDSKVRLAKQTWISPHLLNTSVFIFSETKDDSVPTIVTEGCNTDKNSPTGLPCKINFMYRWLYHNLPPYKWYYRALDDSMLHLPELIRYLRKHDHTKPMMIALRQIKVDSSSWERYEDPTGPENEQRHYPQGGPGWVVSRGFLEKFMTGNNFQVLDALYREFGWADDLIWGIFATDIFHIPITMSRGISKNRPEVNECGFEWTSMSIEELLSSSIVPACPANERDRWDNNDHEPITAFHMGFEHSPNNWRVMDAVMKLFITNKYTTRRVRTGNHSDMWYYVVCPCR